MPQYLIESGVPIPGGSGTGRKIKYPLDRLLVGQSFTVPSTQAGSLSSCASLYGKKSGRVFTTRTEDGLTRIWRIS